VRRSDCLLSRCLAEGSFAGSGRVIDGLRSIPMFVVPAVPAFQATAWDYASHTATKGINPRPLDWQGGSTG
jgi:hypothetical protein